LLNTVYNVFRKDAILGMINIFMYKLRLIKSAYFVNRKVKWTLCYFLCQLSDLPLELLETVLMRTFVMLYLSDSEADDDRCRYQSGKSRSSEWRTFALLASVCSSWRYALIGWPESPTPKWVRHQLKKLIERKYTYT